MYFYTLLATKVLEHNCVCVQTWLFLSPVSTNAHQISQFHRNASSLVIVEHNEETVIPLTYNAISAAQQLGGEVMALVAGQHCSKVHMCANSDLNL